MRVKPIIITMIILFAIGAVVTNAASPWLTGARVAIQNKEWTRAIENCLKEIDKKPEVEAYLLLGTAYAEKREYAMAAEAFENAENAMDTEKEVKKFKDDLTDTRMFYWKKTYDYSNSLYEKARNFDPSTAEAGTTAESKTLEAANSFENADRIFPYIPLNQLMIGACYISLTDGKRYEREDDGAFYVITKDDAGTENKELVSDVKYPELYIVKAYDAYLLALEIKLDDMVSEDIDDSNALALYSDKVYKMAFRLSDFEPASEVLDIAIEQNPGNATLYYNKAQILEKQGDIESAVELYISTVDNAEQGDPYIADCYNALGDIYMSKDFVGKDYDKALEYLTLGNEAQPDNIYVVYSLGKVYHLMGDKTKGSSYYEKGQYMKEVSEKTLPGKKIGEIEADFGAAIENFTANIDDNGDMVTLDVSKYAHETLEFYVLYKEGELFDWTTVRPGE